MPSSPKIPKERILDTALQMLIREGYGASLIRELCQQKRREKHRGH